MPKATITFNLEDQDDQQAFKRFLKSTDMALILWELVHNTKKEMEYEIYEKELDSYGALKLIFERIYDLIEERNINLNELIE